MNKIKLKSAVERMVECLYNDSRQTNHYDIAALGVFCVLDELTKDAGYPMDTGKMANSLHEKRLATMLSPNVSLQTGYQYGRSVLVYAIDHKDWIATQVGSSIEIQDKRSKLTLDVLVPPVEWGDAWRWEIVDKQVVFTQESKLRKTEESCDLPAWIISAIKEEAYDRGHAAGLDEVNNIACGMLETFSRHQKSA